jgi:hypothetical protein
MSNVSASSALWPSVLKNRFLYPHSTSGEKKLQPPQASPTRQPLVPVRVIPVAPAVTEQFIQIMTPSGFSIRCSTAIDTQKLTQIIDAIEVTQ